MIIPSFPLHLSLRKKAVQRMGKKIYIQHQYNYMGYEFKPSPKAQGKKNTLNNILNKLNDRRVFLAAAVVIVAVFVFTGINSVTGFVAQQQAEQEQLQNELDLLTQQRNQCSEELASALGIAADCKKNLDIVNSELKTAKSETGAAKTELSSVKDTLNKCQADITAMGVIIQQLNTSLVGCENEKTALQASYDKLALSAAKAICCRPGDTSSQWSISGDSVVCRGDKTVAC